MHANSSVGCVCVHTHTCLEIKAILCREELSDVMARGNDVNSMPRFGKIRCQVIELKYRKDESRNYF